jgi:alanine racemase
MTSPDLPSGATGVIVIDLAQIGANWRTLADGVRPAQCAAVVKADAYGLGAARVIPALWSAGCRTFFVATPDEAGAAAALVPNTSIFALDGLVTGSAKVLDRVGAIPVLSSLDEVREWSAYARMHNRRLPAALHVDSGLNRLGLSDAEVQTLAMDEGLLAPLDLRLIMSHLASADDPADARNEAQRIAFERQCARLPKAPASLAASDGLMLGPPYHYDLVRPGYALYGGQAFKGGPTPVRPAVSVAARVLQVRDVAVGETVGYSATWRASRPSRIAVLAAGYADGVARALSSSNGHGGGYVGFGGSVAPIIGRVSMDLITVDVTGVRGAVQRGDLAVLIGPGLTIEAMGTASGTIGYEVLTRLGPRFHRRYVGEAQ